MREDDKLIKNFLAGDRSSFDNIVNKYKGLVFNVSIKMLGNYDDALDVSQDIFVKLYGSLKDFKFQSQLSTYLYRMTVNFCKNKIISLSRRRKKEVVNLDDPIKTNDGEIKKEVKSNAPGPREICNENERKEILLKTLEELSLEHKEIIILKDIQGLKYEEIADILNIDLGTVRSRLHRARSSLKIKLEGLL